MSSLIRAITVSGAAVLLTTGLALSPAAFAAEPAAAAKPALTKDQEEGKEIAFDKSKGNCLACHAIADGQLPGNIGPMLIAMKARYPNKEDLFQVIWDPRKKFGRGVIMPPMGDHKILTKEEIDKVVDYLYTL
ncbi:sulfur oxidation c-type cytochrome SoxX [Halothiobacillus sp. DCM-1]|uniref:sulfur oxidation c-type cytochrome SoxX n=1 Tax=Halothiobacillus sp. DCM-1 TaxID=3112558 RepID=UPI00324CB8DB